MKQFLIFLIAAASAVTVLQSQELSINEHLQRFLNDDGLPRTRETVELLLENQAALKEAIKLRLESEASGGEMYNLGVLANTIGEYEFQHFVWKSVAENTVRSSVDPWSMGQILENFVKVARPGDEDLLAQIAGTSVESAPRLPEFAQKKIDSFETQNEIGTEEPESANGAPSAARSEMIGSTRNTGSEANSGEEISPSRTPIWPYVLVAVALLSIVVVLLRSRKGDPGR